MKTYFIHLLRQAVKCTAVSVALVVIGTAVAFAQSSLKGTVTDEQGNPLSGVTVMVSGTTNGTMTDSAGHYTLGGVKAGSQIDFICIGMTTVSRIFDGKNVTINASLAEDSLMLDETVVVGYGTSKKSSLTAAVSAVKGDELLKAPATNVSQVLAGRLPGISSVQESGEPGLDQASLRIRGSVNAVSYVVDGFPVSNINDIDPNDIESISVLKDGASAAIYGLSSSGGVIIVTTKRGKTGKPQITYNGSVGASMNANFPEFMNGPEFAYYYNMAQMMDQLASGAIKDRKEYDPYFTQQNVEDMKAGRDGWDNVNYIDKVFGTGLTQKHSLTMQGGTEKTRYFTSLGYLDQQGNIDNFNYKRYNLRANIDADITKRFHFKLGMSGTVANRKTPAYVSGGPDSASEQFLSIARQTIQMHPYLPEKKDGLYTAAIQKNNSNANSPLAAIYESGYKKTNSVDISANMGLQYDIPGVDGLYIKGSASFDYGTSHNKNLNTPYQVNARQRGTDGWAWSTISDPRGVDTGINLGEGQTQYQRLVGQAGIGYDHTFGKHALEVLALVECRDYKDNSLSAYAKNLPFAGLPELGSSGAGVPADDPIGGWSGASRSAGYVYRVKYDYDNRYLAEFTGRFDGSYKFAGMTSTRWGFFPSASIAWRLSNESFMKNANAIDDLKIRASVGLLGSDAISAYRFLSLYAPDEKVVYTPYNGTASIKPGYYTSAVPNKDLTWEKTLSWNVGFDMNLWDSKLGLEVDGFYNYTYDMLTWQGGDYPPSMGGYYQSYSNNNAYDSKGIDILISHKNSFMLAGSPFYYTVSGSMTYARNRWVIYQDSPNTVEWAKATGKRLSAISGWKSDGLFRSEEEIDNSPWYGTRPNVGDIKYVDVNGDGKIDWDDRGLFGRSNRPELTFGLNIGFNWKGIDFSAQFTGGALFDVSLTGTYYNGYDDNTIWTQTFKEGANSPLYLVQNAWSIDNPNGSFPRLTLGEPGHGGDNGLSSSFWWRKGDYIRLKSAQLGYTLPKKWVSTIGLQTVRFFVEGSNLFTIDGLPKGIDPESPGVNNGYYPQQTLLMGGVTITF